MNKAVLKFETARCPKRIARFARIIIKHKLHIGGLMQEWASPDNLQHVKAITIVTRNDWPIAAGMRFCQSKYPSSLNTGIYVGTKYRRRGIGSNILTRLQIPNIKFVVGQGAWVSVPFYEKQKPKFKNKLVLSWEPNS